MLECKVLILVVHQLAVAFGVVLMNLRALFNTYIGSGGKCR